MRNISLGFVHSLALFLKFVAVPARRRADGCPARAGCVEARAGKAGHARTCTRSFVRGVVAERLTRNIL